MTNQGLFSLLLGLIVTISAANGSEHEKALYNKLLNSYQYLERPVEKFSDPLNISLGVTLLKILNLNTERGEMETCMWITLKWTDVNLRWDPQKFDNISSIQIPPHRIYKPDILIYSSVDPQFDGTYQTNTVVQSNGSITAIYPGYFLTSCKINMTNYPCDVQKCEIQFGSWTYDGGKMNLKLQTEAGADLKNYVQNSEWELLGMPCKRYVKYYTCCVDPYIDIKCTVLLRRFGAPIYTQAQRVNLVLVVVLLLSFLLHPASWHKLTISLVNMGLSMWSPASVHIPQREYYDSPGGMDHYFGCMYNVLIVVTILNVTTVYIYQMTTPVPNWMRSFVAKLQESQLGYICPTVRSPKGDRITPLAVADAKGDSGQVKILDEEQNSQNEWKYLACVLDRFFFIVFLFLVPIFYAVFFPSNNGGKHDMS